MVEPNRADGAEGRYPHVFRPIQVGTLSLDHRLVVPPHGGGNGSLLGTDNRVRAARRALAGQVGRRHALARRRAELRAQPAAARVRAHRRGRARAGLLPRSALSGPHRRARRPGACRWWPALGADGPAGRDADRPVGHPVELRRPSHPPRVGHRRGALVGAGVRRVGRRRDRRRRRRHRDPRQPRRPGAVVPLAADQPAGRRVRRHRRAAAPVPA